MTKKTKFIIPLSRIKSSSQKMSKIIAPTPCVYEWYTSNLMGGDVYMKLENLNIVKSFKIRGALNSILNLDKKKVKGVITASAGNHAQGVAYSATKAGIKSIIVMPNTAPLAKINATKGFGGTVVADKCSTFDECNEYAQKQAKELNYTFVPPFDSEDVIAGQGTIGLEMMQQVPGLDMVTSSNRWWWFNCRSCLVQLNKLILKLKSLVFKAKTSLQWLNHENKINFMQKLLVNQH